MVRPLARIRVVLVAVFLAIQCTPALAGTPVKVGVYNFAPLLFWENGQAQGLYVDVLKEVAAKQQWDLEFVFGTWLQCFNRLQNGEIDLLPCIGWSEERAKKLDFSKQSLFLDWGVIYRRKGSRIQSIFDLAGKRIAVLDGSVYTDALVNLGQQFDIRFTVERENEYITALTRLSNGEVDAAVGTNIYGSLVEDRFDVERTNVVFSPIRLHFATLAGGYDKYLQPLDRIITALKEDKGSLYYTSYDKWMALQGKKGLPAWVSWSVSGLAVALAVLGIIVFTLRRLVRLRTAELKNTADSLAQSEERFRAAFEQAAVGMAHVDLDGRWLMVNKKVCDILGYTSEELLARTFQDVTHPDDLDEDVQSYSRQQKGEFAIYSMEKRYIRKDGSIVWVDMTASLIRDAQGNGLYALSVIQDISERKRVEKELEKARHYIRNIINSMPSVVIGVDADGQVTHYNQEASRHLAGPDRSGVGDTLERAFPEYAGHMESIRRAIRERKPMLLEKRPHQAGGETGYQDLLIYPLIANGVEGAVLRIDDVTERVRLAEMMVQSEKMMSVGGLAAGMAHEINNPLGAILQSAQVLQMYLDPLRETNRKAAAEAGCDMDDIHTFLRGRGVLVFLDNIREAGARAAKIVANMLEFSRRSESSKDLVDVRAILDKSLELAASDYDLKKKYDFRHLSVVRNYGPDVPPVYCSRTEIEQVVLNLLKNAAQAMAGKQYGDETPAITLSTSQAGGMVAITLEDNGPGMDEAVRKRIFEPFFTTKEPGQGTGLGLSVSYFIITNNHGGRIAVDSTPGQGTRFTIELPTRSGGQ